MQPVVELEGESRGGEMVACPQLPELRVNHLPLATGGRCSTKKTQPKLVPGEWEDDTDRFLLLPLTPGSRVAKLTCNYKCILLANDLCYMLGILRDNFPFYFLEKHTAGYFVGCLPLLWELCFLVFLLYLALEVQHEEIPMLLLVPIFSCFPPSSVPLSCQSTGKARALNASKRDLQKIPRRKSSDLQRLRNLLLLLGPGSGSSPEVKVCCWN